MDSNVTENIISINVKLRCGKRVLNFLNKVLVRIFFNIHPSMESFMKIIITGF